MNKNISREEIEKILQEYKSQREEYMRQYQAAHGAVQAIEQLLRGMEKEENNGK